VVIDPSNVEVNHQDKPIEWLERLENQAGGEEQQRDSSPPSGTAGPPAGGFGIGIDRLCRMFRATKAAGS
jgi:lysyl-tRNA synthetase class II